MSEQIISSHLSNIRLLINVVNASNDIVYNLATMQSPTQNNNNNNLHNYNNTHQTNNNTNTNNNNNNNNNNDEYNDNIEQLWSSYLSTLLNGTQTYRNINHQTQRNRNTNNQEVLLRFDTLFPNQTIDYDLIFTRIDPNNINPRVNVDHSYNIVNINFDNSNNLYDTSNNENTHLFDVSEYRVINNPINDICPITRERFYDNQNVLMIKSCKHIFNKSALRIWLRTHSNCPTCRQNIIT
jgi:hypothetical protein